MDPTVTQAIAAVLVLVGLAGTVLPVLPGIAFVFGGLVLAAWADGFVRVGGITIAFLGVLTAVAIAIDFAASAFGAKKFGASPRAVIGAGLGALVGIFFGLPGLVLGPFVGAVVGELSANRELRQAGKAGLGTWIGLLLGSVAKIALAFLMVGIFAVAYGLGA
ncbi:MAG: DUF456 domain-containing protein [Betaproteobacteria bacterium]|nr:DUF456 domain-containing protein [Betaproteobacteria bacterium]